MNAPFDSLTFKKRWPRLCEFFGVSDAQIAPGTYPPQAPFIRIVSILFGLLVMAAAVRLFYVPPVRYTISSRGSESVIGLADSDPSSVTIALLTSGLALLLFGLNGLKFTRASTPAGDASSEPTPLNNASKSPQAPATEITGSSSSTTVLEADQELQKNVPQPEPLSGATSKDSPTTASLDSHSVEGESAGLKQQDGSTAVQPISPEQVAAFMQFYFSQTSWNGLKVLYAVIVGYITGRLVNLKEIATLDKRMSFDYALGVFVGALSTGIFRVTPDNTWSIFSITHVHERFAGLLANEMRRRLEADPLDRAEKRAEIVAISNAFGREPPPWAL